MASRTAKTSSDECYHQPESVEELTQRNIEVIADAISGSSVACTSCLTFVVSLEAIFLSTFILISQNRQNRVAERRNHLDLQINLLSEQENSKILAMLEAISEHLGLPEKDPEVRILEESTRPERLVEQIDTVIDRANGRGKSPEAP